MGMVITPVEVVKTNPLVPLEQHGMRNPSNASTDKSVNLIEKYGTKNSGIVIELLVQLLLHYQTAKLKVNTIFMTVV